MKLLYLLSTLVLICTLQWNATPLFVSASNEDIAFGSNIKGYMYININGKQYKDLRNCRFNVPGPAAICEFYYNGGHYRLRAKLRSHDHIKCQGTKMTTTHMSGRNYFEPNQFKWIQCFGNADINFNKVNGQYDKKFNTCFYEQKFDFIYDNGCKQVYYFDEIQIKRV